MIRDNVKITRKEQRPVRGPQGAMECANRIERRETKHRKACAANQWVEQKTSPRREKDKNMHMYVLHHNSDAFPLGLGTQTPTTHQTHSPTKTKLVGATNTRRCPCPPLPSSPLHLRPNPTTCVCCRRLCLQTDRPVCLYTTVPTTVLCRSHIWRFLVAER